MFTSFDDEPPKRTRPAPRVLNYFGSKVNAAKHYPAPTESKIVEPFAGGAGYSLYWCDHEVSLYDLNSDVIRAWDYLIKTSRQELLSIPLLEMGADARDLPCCEEARLLVRWTTNQASNPINNLCSYAKVHPNSYWGEFRRARTAAVAEQIRHWKVYCESWENSEREGKATYFVDPPYQGSKLGKCYKYNVVDFEALAAFCQSRDGQVIVCDTADATWLPFKPFRTAMGTAQKGGLSKKTSPEGIWVKETT